MSILNKWEVSAPLAQQNFLLKENSLIIKSLQSKKSKRSLVSDAPALKIWFGLF